MIIGITGHNSERLQDKSRKVEEWLIKIFTILQKNYKKNLVLITGMSQGVDQLAAMIAFRMGIQVWCYLPYKLDKMTETEKFIINNSAVVRYEGLKTQKNVFIKRDRRIVDDCQLLLVVWDEIPIGGTYETYKYALQQHKLIQKFHWKRKKQ